MAQVREVSDPEKVYLLGATQMKRRVESVFSAEMPGCRYTAHYYLLVVGGGAGEIHAVQERIESHCKTVVPVTAIVIRGDEFVRWLAEGHPFIHSVVNKAVLPYNRTGEVWTPGAVPDAVIQGKVKRAVYNESTKRVEAYCAGADLYRVRKEYGMAAFMLHQAAECLLRTAIEVMTGYGCQTHNLDKLMRYANLVLWGLPEIFERWKPPNEGVFQLLQQAYIEARYKKGYMVSEAQSDAMFEKVRRLREHVQEVYMSGLTEV